MFLRRCPALKERRVRELPMRCAQSVCFNWTSWSVSAELRGVRKA